MEAAIGHNSLPSTRNNDWIAVYRGLRTHPVVGFLNIDGTRKKGATVCQSMAWIDLCMEANWKDRKENNNGKVILVERGQLQGGRNWLAERWGWTENQVRWFLKKLQDDGMIQVERPKIATKMNTGATTNRTASSAHFTNVITINNYNTYQTISELSELLDNQSNHQSNNQSTTKQPPHSNKETNKQTTLHWRERANLDKLETALLTACNGAASAAASPGLLSMAEPIKWLESGCDLELDILPTVKARAHKLRPGSLKAWSYFTDAIADAKATRLKPMPNGGARPNYEPKPRRKTTDEMTLEEYRAHLERGGV